MSDDPERVVRLGTIVAVYGVKGWIKIHSFTEPRGNVVNYSEWIVEQDGKHRTMIVEQAKTTPKNVLAKLEGIDDRDAAAALIGTKIGVPRSALPDCMPGEYYWADLEGMTVKSRDGQILGTVDHLLATGANDVLALSGGADRLIPFVPDSVVLDVDLAAGVIIVDWDETYWD